MSFSVRRASYATINIILQEIQLLRKRQILQEKKKGGKNRIGVEYDRRGSSTEASRQEST